MSTNLEKNSSKLIAAVAAGTIALSQVIPAHAALQGASSKANVNTDSYQVAMLIRPPSGVSEADRIIEKVFSSAATSRITRVLDGARRECSRVGAEYEASCTAQAYKRAARAENRPDYRAANRILNKASRDLSRLVSRNADKSAPKKKSGRRTYTAVKKTAVKKVARQAVKIIAEAETKLIRSASSGQRKVHYQRIAKAVGSTKVIFRS